MIPHDNFLLFCKAHILDTNSVYRKQAAKSLGLLAAMDDCPDVPDCLAALVTVLTAEDNRDYPIATETAAIAITTILIKERQYRVEAVIRYWIGHLPIGRRRASATVHGFFASLLLEMPSLFLAEGVVEETIRITTALVDSALADDASKTQIRGFITSMRLDLKDQI
jgi:hypothetical protein